MILFRSQIVGSFAVETLISSSVWWVIRESSTWLSMLTLKTSKLVCLESLVVGSGALESVSAKRSDVPFLYVTFMLYR